ncbi:MAG: peptide ABC transporter substrate-binding protein [Chloroflexi bacterium]|nr:peptide ABC transporter substrate-binding protein [Chloroflexota bacterium]
MLPSPKTFAARFLIVLLLTSALALAGCKSIATTVARDLRLNLGLEPATLDPALATDPGSLQVMRMLFLSLADTEPTTGTPEHALANSWAVSADGLIWEFKLRTDAQWVRYIPATQKFETKRAVTAEDVVYSVRRVFDPRTGSGFAPVVAPLIRGAEQLRSADPKKTTEAMFEQLFANLGVHALDAATVRFTLTRPTSFFPSIVSAWLVRTQPKEAIEAGGSVWTDPGVIWSNGPYVMESWQHGREIVLLKNPYWYDASLVKIEHIRFTMIADTATALEEFRSGNLDSLDPYGGLTAEDVDHLKEDPILGRQLKLVPSLCTHYYGFNTTKPPFNELLVRKAFAAAIDRETLVTSVVKLGEPARWFTRPGIVASADISDTVGIPFNANQARDYLRQAGYDAKKRLPTITLSVNTNDINERIGETVVQMWKNNLGVEVSVKALDWKSYSQALRDDPPQVFRLAWCGYIPDAGDFVGSVFRGGTTYNYTRWSSLALDQTVDAAARETDLVKRKALYRAADKMLVEENVAIVPLWWATRATLTRPGVQRTFAVTDGYERLETWAVP